MKKIFFLIIVLFGCNKPILLKEDDNPIIERMYEINYFIYANIPNKPCPDDMVHINRDNLNFCIDKYEFPNIKGIYPIAAVDALEAEELAKKSGKRLCSYTEWYYACIGSGHYAYSYGHYFDRHKCNTDATGYIPVDWSKMANKTVWKEYAKTLYKAEPSGFREGCVSDEGVYDMPGNVREIVKADIKSINYQPYWMLAGYWFNTMHGVSSCTVSTIKHHGQNFSSPEFGFRCCKDINK